MLTAHPDMDAMFASNESSTVGAAQALKGRKGRVLLVGFDSSPTLLEDLQSGLIDSLVVQDPFRMGYESVQAAVKKLRGGTPEKMQNMPPLLVTKRESQRSRGPKAVEAGSAKISGVAAVTILARLRAPRPALPHLPCQDFRREWLLQKGSARLEHSALHDRFGRISRHEQHAYLPPKMEQPPRELMTAGCRQHHVRQE